MATPLDGFDPALHRTWERALAEGKLTIDCHDRFEAQSIRNDLYRYRRAYRLANPGDPFGHEIAQLKISAPTQFKLIVWPKWANSLTHRLGDAVEVRKESTG